MSPTRLQNVTDVMSELFMKQSLVTRIHICYHFEIFCAFVHLKGVVHWNNANGSRVYVQTLRTPNCKFLSNVSAVMFHFHQKSTSRCTEKPCHKLSSTK